MAKAKRPRTAWRLPVALAVAVATFVGQHICGPEHLVAVTWVGSITLLLVFPIQVLFE